MNQQQTTRQCPWPFKFLISDELTKVERPDQGCAKVWYTFLLVCFWTFALWSIKVGLQLRKNPPTYFTYEESDWKNYPSYSYMAMCTTHKDEVMCGYGFLGDGTKGSATRCTDDDGYSCTYVKIADLQGYEDGRVMRVFLAWRTPDEEMFRDARLHVYLTGQDMSAKCTWKKSSQGSLPVSGTVFNNCTEERTFYSVVTHSHEFVRLRYTKRSFFIKKEDGPREFHWEAMMFPMRKYGRKQSNFQDAWTPLDGYSYDDWTNNHEGQRSMYAELDVGRYKMVSKTIETDPFSIFHAVSVLPSQWTYFVVIFCLVFTLDPEWGTRKGPNTKSIVDQLKGGWKRVRDTLMCGPRQNRCGLCTSKIKLPRLCQGAQGQRCQQGCECCCMDYSLTCFNLENKDRAQILVTRLDALENGNLYESRKAQKLIDEDEAQKLMLWEADQMRIATMQQLSTTVLDDQYPCTGWLRHPRCTTVLGVA